MSLVAVALVAVPPAAASEGKTARARKREAEAAQPKQGFASRKAYHDGIEKLRAAALKRLKEGKPLFTDEDLETFTKLQEKTVMPWRHMHARRAPTRQTRLAQLECAVRNHGLQQRLQAVNSLEDLRKLLAEPLIDLGNVAVALLGRAGRENASVRYLNYTGSGRVTGYQVVIRGRARTFTEQGLREALPDLCQELGLFRHLEDE